MKPGRKIGSIPWNKGLKGVYKIWPNGRPPFSEETRKKIGLAGLGRIPWNKNKKHLQIRGNRNPNWKGGITSQDQILRSRIEFKIWKRKVFSMNEHRCNCGTTTQLIAHHIKPFDKYLKLRYDPKNGKIMCRACHLKLHKPRRKYV